MKIGRALFLRSNSVPQCPRMCAISSQSRKVSYAMAAFSTRYIHSRMSKSIACCKQPGRTSVDSYVNHDLPTLSSKRLIAYFKAAI